LIDSNEDDFTIITSNALADTHISMTSHSRHTPPTLAATARHIFGTPTLQYSNVITIATNQAIAHTSAMSIFIMDGLDMVNKRVAKKPLTINFPDGKQIMSMHICNIIILGLPTVLTGHIAPLLKVASLIKICPLCKAGCTVIFDNKKCDVIFNGNVILWGCKDPTTNSWTFLLPTKVFKNSLIAIGGHDSQYFNELRSTVVSRRIFIRLQSLIAR
jgi:hypothetical protein